jgi:hypothetical protein
MMLKPSVAADASQSARTPQPIRSGKGRLTKEEEIDDPITQRRLALVDRSIKDEPTTIREKLAKWMKIMVGEIKNFGHCFAVKVGGVWHSITSRRNNDLEILKGLAIVLKNNLGHFKP